MVIQVGTSNLFLHVDFYNWYFTAFLEFKYIRTTTRIKIKLPKTSLIERDLNEYGTSDILQKAFSPQFLSLPLAPKVKSPLEDLAKSGFFWL